MLSLGIPQKSWFLHLSQTVPRCSVCFHYKNIYQCLEYMKWDLCHIFTPELHIKTTLYVHTVTSHCVICRYIIEEKSAIVKTVWVLFCICVITDSILVDLYPPFRRHWHTWKHTLMLIAHNHTPMHMQHTNMHGTVHSHTQHHTHHHVHAGWRLSSPFCKPGGAWQDSGDSP